MSDAGIESSSGRGRKYTLRAAVIRYVKIIPVKIIFGIEDVMSWNSHSKFWLLKFFFMFVMFK
jgi:hypothetical protein